MATKHKVGRPPKWETPEELAALIQIYFDTTDEAKISITGLTLAITTSRNLLIQYSKKPGFKEVIEHAKLIVENAYENRAIEKGRAGDIFGLKQFGWSDKQEIDLGINDKLAKIINKGKFLAQKYMESEDD